MNTFNLEDCEAVYRNLVIRLTVCLAIAISVSLVHAEHRVALLIDNSEYQDDSLHMPAGSLSPLTAALEKFGVRCTILKDLDGESLKSAIDSFAHSTPTRGAAFVYFRGHVLPGVRNGSSGIFLVATDAKASDGRSIGNTGVDIDLLLEMLNTKGGSSLNAVVVDAASDPPRPESRLPDGCLLAFADGESLVEKIDAADDLLTAIQSVSVRLKSNLPAGAAVTGKGASVVAPPGEFVIGKHAGDQWVNSRGMVFCWCPPGSYVAGSPTNEPARYPDEAQREVVIEDGFWISKYELTLRENLRNHPRDTIATHKNHPLTMIHLDDARSMTTRTLSEQERNQGRLPNDWQYTLPTEDQWEFAARAGTTSRFYFGDDLAELPQHANFGDKTFYDTKDIFANAAHRTLADGAAYLAIVGSYEANPWGLHDVYGNVGEWCIDTALRGGAWVSRPENCRSAYRDWFSNRNEQNFIGYRLVIQKIPAEAAKR